MSRTRIALMLTLVVLALAFGCKKKADPPKQIDSFNCDTPDRLISGDFAAVDGEGAAEGKGCLIMVADQPKTVALFEVKNPGDGGAKFIVQFKMKVQGFLGDAYGQMNVSFDSGGKQEINNRECCALGADSDWIPMTLAWEVKDKSKKVSAISLYAVLNGSGTAWVDDVKVIRAPLP